MTFSTILNITIKFPISIAGNDFSILCCRNSMTLTTYRRAKIPRRKSDSGRALQNKQKKEIPPLSDLFFNYQ